jgi:DNA-binding NtrC family response regulator
MVAASDRRFLEALSELIYCNPFEPRRLELEQMALGTDFEPEDQVAWSKDIRREDADRPNVIRLTARAEQLLDTLRVKLRNQTEVDDRILELYDDLVSYVLYYRHMAKLPLDAMLAGGKSLEKTIALMWEAFDQQFAHYMEVPPRKLPGFFSAEHLFACFYQVRRAFRFVFDNILGDSNPAARLRSEVWQSIFTHDMRRYRRSLFDKMRQNTTLITGPSGTGKELVAQAVSLSQYIPFNADKQQFAGDLQHAFLSVNLSALSATLIESELFGHCKGAFTGAIADRQGWLERCPPHGAVFLDEIGELDPLLQVKLLRVVQTGTYSRVGENTERKFYGKLVAATNRDLGEEMRRGRFREDLYYRLCSDRIETPQLGEHLDDSPDALAGLISFIVRRIAPEESNTLRQEVLSWVEQNLGLEYRWPGNIRELEQCVRNVLIRQRYVPQRPAVDRTEVPASKRWLAQAEAGELTFAELLTAYVTWSYAKTGSYQQTAQLLGLDRRTVRSKVDAEILATIKKDCNNSAYGNRD